MKSKVIIFVVVLNLLVLTGYSQKKTVEAANQKYEKYAFVDAIAMFERVAAKGYRSADMFQKLGNAYYFNADPTKAVKWYSELFKMKNTKIASEYYYRYAQSLKAVGDYTKASEIMDAFVQQSGNDLRAQLYSRENDYLEEIRINSDRYKVEDAGVNSEYSDYGSAVIDGKLVFASARDTSGIIKSRHKWTNQSFTSLYSADVGEAKEPVKFGKKLDSRFHESTPVFSKDGQTMYFTRNNFNDGKKGKSGKQITLLKIYRATRGGDEWQNVTELPFNSNNYSVAHPALTPDGKFLYFASDMPGTLGQSDLFRVVLNSDGSYGKPENLGKTINTEGRETFPSFTDENELYFASDGRPGLGGLDIYRSVRLNDGTLAEPQNIGSPANSPKDDFAFIFDSRAKTGYFSSNRDGGKGFDDIYKFTEIRSLKCEQHLAGVVTDAVSGDVLAGAKVTLSDQQFTILKEVIADEKGRFDFDAACGATYFIKGEKINYSTTEKSITIAATSGKSDLPLQLTKKLQEILVGSDLAKVLEIKTIYFDRDKSDIRQDAAAELEKILAVLQQYPAMKIDIRSHTDSRQTHKYNEQLSDRRAKATMQWLISNGIVPERLSAKGYGEVRLLNNCSDGIECSEEEHQLNRRSEFIITQM